VGGGGSTNQTATLTVPIPVEKSSYENKALAGKALGPQNLPIDLSSSNAFAFADFFQDGTYSMVANTQIYNRDDPNTANMYGSIRFYQKVGGAWVDNTSKLLSDVKGCINPRKAIVADFNGDHKPDVFFACHGFDAAPYAGEQQHVLLSQADGTYKNVTLQFNCYCHGASAADLTGTGYSDILVTDNQTNETVPFFLINDHNGGFTKDLTRLPFKGHQYSVPNTTFTQDVLFTAELIDFDKTGHYDAFLAGTEAPDDPAGIRPTIFKNDGTNNFKASFVQLPANVNYETTLDIVFDGQYIYLNRVQTNGGAYGYSAIDKIDYKSMMSQTIWSNSSKFQNGYTWLPWIIQYQGKIASESASYGVSI
jgi:hypothetical protein